jgi:mannose/fructose/N-acetylgalactosamine-specific phosphotransferase system component IID
MVKATPNYRFGRYAGAGPARRQLVLVIVLMALAAAAGFVWGQHYGYRQGRNDIMKQIEQQLNAAPAAPGV